MIDKLGPAKRNHRLAVPVIGDRVETGGLGSQRNVIGNYLSCANEPPNLILTSGTITFISQSILPVTAIVCIKGQQ